MAIRIERFRGFDLGAEYVARRGFQFGPKRVEPGDTFQLDLGKATSADRVRMVQLLRLRWLMTRKALDAFKTSTPSPTRVQHTSPQVPGAGEGVTSNELKPAKAKTAGKGGRGKRRTDGPIVHEVGPYRVQAVGDRGQYAVIDAVGARCSGLLRLRSAKTKAHELAGIPEEQAA